MLEDGVGHFLRLAVVQRVDAAHDALQFGELAHHARGQVGLAQLGRFGQRLGVAAAGGAVQPEGQLAQAMDALQLGAQPLHEGAAAQLLDAGAQADLAVFVEEELSVGEAGAQDALVASAADGRIAHLGVGDGHEGRQERAALVLHREVLLVAAHLGDEHLGRQLEEFLVEGAGDPEGFFDQARHRLEQIIVGPRNAACLARRALHLLRDTLLALIPVREHVCLAQPVDVFRRARERKLLRRMEAVAAGGEPARHVGELHLQRLSVEGRGDPMHRPRERVGLERVPAHRLAEGYTTYQAREQLGQHFCSCHALGHHRSYEAAVLFA